MQRVTKNTTNVLYNHYILSKIYSEKLYNYSFYNQVWKGIPPNPQSLKSKGHIIYLYLSKFLKFAIFIAKSKIST